MARIEALYTRAIQKNFRPLFANWEPGRDLKLGDYGVLSGKSLIYVGNVADLGVTFTQRVDPTKDQKSFTSEGSVDITTHAKGEVNAAGVKLAQASVDIAFSAKHAVYFNAAECSYCMIENKAKLGDQIVELFKAGKWQRKWVIVTDLVRAGATTVVISGSSSASISLGAQGDVPHINLANADLELSPKHESNIGYKVISESGMVPLIGLGKIQRKFIFFGHSFEPLRARHVVPETVSTMEDDPDIKTENSHDELYFGQVID